MAATFQGNRLEQGIHKCGVSAILNAAQKNSVMGSEIMTPGTIVDVQALVQNYGNTLMLIDGKLVGSECGDTFTDRSPLTGLVLVDKLARAGITDADEAVQAARRCFDSEEWRKVPIPKRALKLLGLIQLLQQNAEQIAYLQASDSGMPLQACRDDIAKAMAIYEHYATSFASLLIYQRSESSVFAPGLRSYCSFESAGVVAASLSWRCPMSTLASILAPAILCGNTLIIKVCESCPLVPLKFAQLLCLQCPTVFPPGLINFITGRGKQVGAHLIRHPDIDRVVFFGRSRVLRFVAEACALARPRCKQLLAVGKGRATAIIALTAPIMAANDNIGTELDDEIDRAVSLISDSAFSATSATGSAKCYIDKVLVPRSLFTTVLTKLSSAAAVAASHQGDPFRATTKLGPMSSRDAFHRAVACIEKCLEEGAVLVAGGSANIVEDRNPGSQTGSKPAPPLLSTASSHLQSVSISASHPSRGLFVTPTVFDCSDVPIDSGDMKDDDLLGTLSMENSPNSARSSACASVDSRGAIFKFCLGEEMIGPIICLYPYDSSECFTTLRRDWKQAAARAACINSSDTTVLLTISPKPAPVETADLADSTASCVEDCVSMMTKNVRSEIIAVNSIDISSAQIAPERILSFYTQPKLVIVKD